MDTTAAQAANALFIQLASNTQERIENGLHLREMMREDLAKGVTPTGYRAEWIQSTVARLNELMGECAREFNEDHVDDMVSVADLADVAATLQARIIRASMAGQEETQSIIKRS